MERPDINNFLNKHCRIKLRSGKEVFGILWEESAEGRLYFSSAGDRQNKFRHNPKDTALSLDPEDIIYAEALRDQMAS